MSFKLKFGDLRGGVQSELVQGLNYLANKEFDNIRESNNLRRMLKQIRKIMIDTADEQTAILKNMAEKFGKKDENGALIPMVENGVPVPNSYTLKDECLEDYKKAMKELEELETPVIESYKINISSLEKMKLPPVILAMIEPVLNDDLEECTTGEQAPLPFKKD